MSVEDFELEEAEFSTLRQIVEWVAFGLPPLTDKDDRAFRQEGNIRLMYISDLKSPRSLAIRDAQQKIFLALRHGILPSQTVGIDEIEPHNYHPDIPDFRFIAEISGPQKLRPDLWQYERIYWSDSSLTYDNPSPSHKADGRFGVTWFLAKTIWADTKKMYEVFPPTKSITKERAQKPPGRKKGDGAYNDEPHLLKMKEHIDKKTAKSIHDAAQKVVAAGNVEGASEPSKIHRLSEKYNKKFPL